MTANELWCEYIGSIDDDLERREVIDDFSVLSVEGATLRFGDAAEYIMLVRAGKVAPMPEMPSWA